MLLEQSGVGAEWSRVEQSGAEWSRVEQSGAGAECTWSRVELEQSGAEWSRVYLEQSGAECSWSRVEQSEAEWSRVEQSGAEWTIPHGVPSGQQFSCFNIQLQFHVATYITCARRVHSYYMKYTYLTPTLHLPNMNHSPFLFGVGIILLIKEGGKAGPE